MRAKYFKDMSIKDSANVQCATDSLLNFETVKYFNAEHHEQDKFYQSLIIYKGSVVVVAVQNIYINLI